LGAAEEAGLSAKHQTVKIFDGAFEAGLGFGGIPGRVLVPDVACVIHVRDGLGDEAVVELLGFVDFLAIGLGISSNM
jgi:hypothetical protein